MVKNQISVTVQKIINHLIIFIRA